MDKKIIAILRWNFLLNRTYGTNQTAGLCLCCVHETKICFLARRSGTCTTSTLSFLLLDNPDFPQSFLPCSCCSLFRYLPFVPQFLSSNDSLPLGCGCFGSAAIVSYENMDRAYLEIPTQKEMIHIHCRFVLLNVQYPVPRFGNSSIYFTWIYRIDDSVYTDQMAS